MTEAPKSLPAALAVLQTKLPEIKKSETAQVQTKQGSYSYSYANLAGISAQILPLLGELGLSFIARPTFSGDRFVLACSLLHVSGGSEDAEYPLPTSGTPQAIGSAITYGRRYCLCAMTGVAPEDDDDGAAAEAEAASKRGTAQRARPSQRAKPSTGRTAQRDRTTEPPPLPNESWSMNKDQRAALMISFDELGLGGPEHRDERLRLSSEIVGRELSSANDLADHNEFRRLMDGIDQRKEQPFSGETADPAGDPPLDPQEAQ